MKTTLLFLLGGVVAGIALWWWARSDAKTVSSDWRADQQRREMGAGLDGVAWRWPVRPDEQSWRDD